MCMETPTIEAVTQFHRRCTALDALKPSTFDYATEKLLGDAMAMSEQASVMPQ